MRVENTLRNVHVYSLSPTAQPMTLELYSPFQSFAHVRSQQLHHVDNVVYSSSSCENSVIYIKYLDFVRFSVEL